MRVIVVIIFTLAPVFGSAWAQTDLAAGQRGYEVCAGCHGFDGEGNQLVAAPRLAGMEPWYFERQMRNFSAGIRGHADGDTNGRRMALMAQAIDSERELGDLRAYVESLPAGERPNPIVEGDAGRGQSGYALCAACHGPGGRGNESIAAPSLVTLDAWYLVEQLELYAEGLRGTNTNDIYGQQMRALLMSFDTDDERRDLAAFIDSIER